MDVARNQQRIFIPPRYENSIIDHYHNINHLGVRATQRFICDRYLFPAMKRKIGDRVRACTACQRTKVVRHVVSPIASAKMPKSRFTTVHADLCGPYPECQGFSYLLVCIDRFTRFVSVYPLRNLRTESAIIGINSHVATFGQMQTLRVDNGVQWTSKLFRDYCKFLGCDLCISNTRYPESNDLVERAIKNIKVALTAKLDRENWMFYVGSIVLSLNSMYREELGCSSADLVFFQALRLPGDILLTEHPPDTPFSEHLVRQMQQFATTIRPVPTRVEQNKRVYMPPQLKTCTHIFVKQDPIKPNLTPAYAGPYLVISRTDKTFRVMNNSKIMSVAINNVKPCFQLKNSQEIEAETAIFAETNNNQWSHACHDANEVDPTSMFSSNSPSDDSDNTESSRYSADRQNKRKRQLPRHLADYAMYV